MAWVETGVDKPVVKRQEIGKDKEKLEIEEKRIGQKLKNFGFQEEDKKKLEKKVCSLK